MITVGNAAVKYAHQHLRSDAESRPDLIRLDLNLNGVDGVSIVDMFDKEIDAQTLVLVLSNSTATEDVKRRYEKGCNAYLTKSDDMGAT